MGNCFSCHKKLGLINNWRDSKHIREHGYQPPDGMSKDDKLCESCLKLIVITQVKRTAESKKQTFCSKCGKLLNGNANYCINCGFEINKLPESDRKNKKMSKNDIIKNMVVIGVIILIFIGILALIPRDPKPGDDIFFDMHKNQGCYLSTKTGQTYLGDYRDNVDMIKINCNTGKPMD